MILDSGRSQGYSMIWANVLHGLASWNIHCTVWTEHTFNGFGYGNISGSCPHFFPERLFLLAIINPGDCLTQFLESYHPGLHFLESICLSNHFEGAVGAGALLGIGRRNELALLISATGWFTIQSSNDSSYAGFPMR